jgi:type II secretory pathway component PulK
MKPAKRRAVALFWALVIATVVSAILAVTTAKILAARRLLEQRQNHLQADWLARSGIEIAAGRLLANPAGYTGESVEPIPSSRVRIEVSPVEDAIDTFQINVEARFPLNGAVVVLRRANCQFKRSVSAGQVRVELVASGAR